MKKTEKLGLIGVTVFAVFVLGIAIMQPYFEAKSYNRLTGGDATYWDAVWSELRIDGNR